MAGGRIRGAIRYGHIVIESGGEIFGDMQTLDGVEADDGTDMDETPEADVAEPPKSKRSRSKSSAEKK